MNAGKIIKLTDGTTIEAKMNFGTIFYLDQIGGSKSDIKKTSTAYYQTKNLIEAINGNDDNAFTKRWGGEILYNNYEVIVNERVGADRGVHVVYGKNIGAESSLM